MLRCPRLACPAFDALQVYMSEVALYTDYKLDESYTPARVSIRVGNTFSDLREVGGLLGCWCALDQEDGARQVADGVR